MDCSAKIYKKGGDKGETTASCYVPEILRKQKEDWL